MNRILNASAARVGAHLARLRDEGEAGAETTEWIFIVVGALVIGGVVIAAITAFVDGQIALLPGG